MKKTSTSPRRVLILATPTVQSLELAGPVEVFAMANHKLTEAGRDNASGYAIEVLAATDDLVIHNSSGLSMLAHHIFREAQSPADTLLVAGGMELWSAHQAPGLIDWLQSQARQLRRIASVCTGAFQLAEAGILDGHRVTTHWYFCQRLQQEFPRLQVDPEPIFIRDGAVATSAGVSTGLDLALSFVEEDFGIDIALRVARALVLFLRRYEGQNQFSTSLALQATSRVPLRELPIFIQENLGGNLLVEALAARVAMSVRNFSRVFREEFRMTPAQFVEQMRVETAQRMVTESDKSLEEIAALVGIGSIDSMRRSFVKRFGRTPADFRSK